MIQHNEPGTFSSKKMFEDIDREHARRVAAANKQQPPQAAAATVATPMMTPPPPPANSLFDSTLFSIVGAIIFWWLWRKFRRRLPVDTSMGSAHFAERHEIDHLLKPIRPPAPGELILGIYKERSLFRLKNKFVVLPRALATRHVLIAAPSGAGKSRSIFLPNCHAAGKTSFIATDPKSELWKFTSGRQLNPIRFAPREPDASSCFNWIPLCKDARAAALCVWSIVYSEGVQNGDKFWTNNERGLLTALFSHVAHTDCPTPAHAYELLCSGVASLMHELMNSQSSAAQRAARTLFQSDEKVFTGVIQGLVGKMQWLEDDNVRRFTSSSKAPFDFGILREKPTQVFWCLTQRDVADLQPLTALFFNLAIATLIDCEGTIPVNLFFDEFANIGRLLNFDKHITLLRGQNIAVIAGLQARAQLDSIYGRDDAETIFGGGFNTKISLAGMDDNTAEIISKALGEFTHNEVRTSVNRQGFFKATTSDSYHAHARRLMTADEIRRLPDKQILVKTTNLPPVILDKIQYNEPERPAKIRGCGLELEPPTYTPIDMDAPKGKKKKTPPPPPPDLDDDSDMAALIVDDDGDVRGFDGYDIIPPTPPAAQSRALIPLRLKRREKTPWDDFDEHTILQVEPLPPPPTKA
jgi:type IV secretory pathway TraG/TraD family ATPase VirD4